MKKFKKGIRPWQGYKNEVYKRSKTKLKKKLRAFNKGHQVKDEEYPPLADNSKIGL